MKIASPTQENKRVQSLVHGHSGTAHYFVIVETEDHSFEVVENVYLVYHGPIA